MCEGKGLIGPRKVDRRPHTTTRRLGDCLARTGIPGVEGFGCTKLKGSLTLGMIDIGDENRFVGQRAGKLESHHADTTETDDEQRPDAQVGDRLLDGAVAGEARTHEGTGDLGCNALHVEQVARVWYADVAGIAAIDGNPERLWRIAQMLVAARAQAALAAADPGIGGVELAANHALRVGPDRLHGASDLMAQREGQRPVAAHVELLPTAQIEVAILQVNVGVADPTM